MRSEYLRTPRRIGRDNFIGPFGAWPARRREEGSAARPHRFPPPVRASIRVRDICVYRGLTAAPKTDCGQGEGRDVDVLPYSDPVSKVPKHSVGAWSCVPSVHPTDRESANSRILRSSMKRLTMSAIASISVTFHCVRAVIKRSRTIVASLFSAALPAAVTTSA